MMLHRLVCHSLAPFKPLSEQDPKILELLHLRKGLIKNLESANYLFTVMNHDLEILIFIPVASHLNRPNAHRRSNRTTHAKSKDEILLFPNQTSSSSWLHPEILSIKNRTHDKGKPWDRPKCTRKSSYFRQRNNILLCHRSKRYTPRTSRRPPTGHLERHGQTLSPYLQSTCGLV